MMWGISFVGVDVVFRHPERVWFFLLVPFFIILAIWEARKRYRVRQHPWMRQNLLTARLPGAVQRIGWWFWFCVGFALIVSVVMVPERKNIDWEKIYGRIRLTFLLDTSLSQFFAEDLPPNRMNASRRFISGFVDLLQRDEELKGRYTLALIPFAGTANPVFMPFTTSREEMRSNLGNINERTVTMQGTSVWAALKAYDELLLWYPPREEKGEEGSTLDLGILISDGGKEEGRGVERAAIPKLMEELRDPYRTQTTLENQRYIYNGSDRVRSVSVYTVGVGAVRVDGAGNRIAVPTPLIIRDRQGNLLCYYREKEKIPLDPQCPQDSAILTSELDEEFLREIAETQGGGKYYHLSSNHNEILEEFKKVILAHRKEIGRRPHDRYEPAFFWFAAPAFIIFYFLFGYGGWLKRFLRITLRMGNPVV